MRILQLTPGTGNFYCGNCIRDNALVNALQKLGHECTLVPMYLPMLTEGPSAADGEEVQFGGINAYLQQKSSVFRKAPRWVDRLFNAPWMLRMAAKRAGMTKASELGEMTNSMLAGEMGHQAKEIDKLVEWIGNTKQVDVVNLSNCLLIGLARRIKEALGVPVVCTLMGEDAYLDALPEDDSNRAWDMLTERAKGLDAFVAVSQYYGDVMKNRMSLRDDQLRVVYNGVSLDGYADSSEKPDAPTLGYFARMCHGKGLHILVDAFIELKKRDTIPNLKLRVAGTKTEIDDLFIAEQKTKLAKANLTDAAKFIPNVPREEKIRFLESLSVLSVPVIYGESFGMYLIEAMAAGVPVVQPNSGAFPEIVDQTGGGVIYEPAPGSSALADAIEGLLSNPDRAKQLGEQGRQSVREKFTVDHMARGVVEVYESVLATVS